MDLKNKLSEEEAIEILSLILTSHHIRAYTLEYSMGQSLNILKQAGIIRKSARKEMDEFIKEAYIGIANSQIRNRLEQLLAAERAESKGGIE